MGDDRPWILDLFCGAGGCSEGYHRAGFHVYGVDHKPQRNYPFGMFQADALEFLRALPKDHRFDAFHASPPCQGYSRMRHLPWLKGRTYPMLIKETIELLEATGKPWVVENVADAWPEMTSVHSIMLCGTMFDLKVYRHRIFGSNQLLFQPPHRKHKVVIGKGRMLNDRAKPNSEGWTSLPSKASGTPLNGLRPTGDRHPVAGHFANIDLAKEAMDIYWMNRDELAQAIPPAYTEFIGKQLAKILSQKE